MTPILQVEGVSICKRATSLYGSIKVPINFTRKRKIQVEVIRNLQTENP